MTVIRSSDAIVSPSILVVENERLIALDIETHLRSLGYQISGIEETGPSSIQAALSLRPDLILMDIRLQGEMDGIEAATRIIELFDVPIIFLTAFGDIATLDKAKKISPFGYIMKPFDSIDLQTSIEIALHKHHSEQIIKQQKHWLNTVLESIGDAVITTDTHAKITFINRMAESLTQWSKVDALGQDINTVIPLVSSEKHPIENPIIQALQRGKGEALKEGTLLITKDKQEIPVDDSAVLILNDYQEVYGAVMVFRDVTEQLQAKQQLMRQAYYDPLTQLPNRVLFITRLQHVVDLNKRYSNCQYAVLFLDLDRFKIVNDSLGHEVGDQLITTTAQRLQKCLRPTDTVARLGGDEFVILLEKVSNLDMACQLAQRVNNELSLPCELGEYAVSCSASIGIVHGTSQYDKAEDVVRDADIAMYQAKIKGKKRYAIFDEAMYMHVKRRLTLENDLRRAIHEQTLTVHYQPIVSLVTQKITSFEALIRWEHPERGLLLPHIFVPIAEEVGLIVQLDRWVLRQACRQVKVWQDQHPQVDNFGVSVNLSSHHFSRSDMVQQIKEILAETQFPASNLQLEITETALIENPGSAAQVLMELKRLGIQIAIDDFGTGFSSLSYLHRYPIDTLKIDRSFIQNIDSNSNQFKIAHTVMLLSETLDMVAIAEGIETDEQKVALISSNCEYAQGYYFHKPLTTENITALLKK